VATRRKADFSRVFGTLASIFKNVPDDKIADLQDALDVDAAGDNWNSEDGRTRNDPVGREEAASGGGATRMVAAYSDVTRQEGISADYAAMGDRLSDLEKSFNALAGVVMEAVKAGNLPFPKGDAERYTAKAQDDEERADEEDGEADDTAKSKMRVMNVPALMRELAGYSKGSNKSGLTVPPDFASHLAKGGLDVSAVLATEIERMPLHDAITCKSIYARMRSGHMDLATRSLSTASDNVKVAFAKAGLVAHSESNIALKRI
jgi:hypothetical protein